MEKDFTDIKKWMLLRRGEIERYEKSARPEVIRGLSPDDELKYVLVCLELIEEVERLRKLTKAHPPKREGGES